MARQKKQYRPIAGQKRWEKVLDWVVREENFKYFAFVPWIYLLLFLGAPFQVATFIFDRSDIIDPVFRLWKIGFVPVILISFINSFASDWGLRMERKLKQPIKDHITQHGPCTYDELISLFMPIKIHLGIDAALESLVNSRDLVCDGDLYRLPSPEDRKRWFDAWFEDYSKDYTFGLLEDIFALDLKRFECDITVQFYTRSGADFWISKEEDESSGLVHYRVMLSPEKTLTFETFPELADSRIFDGQTLRKVWEDHIVLTYINDEDVDWWLEMNLH